ncbi:MAG: hypothetical protein P8L91_06255, partial [Candidatus Marinimicrobia bacterium]|nr:hypothetical protein [Candidatus Neomarinimicrobiota bacterium]
FLLFAISFNLFSQTTEVIKKTDIYTSPNKSKDNIIGEILPGASIKKLKKDKSGKFIKATIEFYIPVESLLEGRVSHEAGTTQLADNAKYKLISSKINGNQVEIKLRVANISHSKELDFSAMALLKAIGSRNNKGELNPFKGKHQDLAIISPRSHVIAELYYDFKSKPKNIELICMGKLGGDRIYYNLGY